MLYSLITTLSLIFFGLGALAVACLIIFAIKEKNRVRNLDPTVTSTVEPAPAKRRGRPPGSKNKPKKKVDVLDALDSKHSDILDTLEGKAARLSDVLDVLEKATYTKEATLRRAYVDSVALIDAIEAFMAEPGGLPLDASTRMVEMVQDFHQRLTVLVEKFCK